jgi:hypothetical protein
MINTLKRIISYIPGVRLKKGYGLSCDDKLSFKERDLDLYNDPNTARYRLRDNVGYFVIDAIVQSPSGPLYRMKHPQTGDVFTISKGLFSLLFKYIPPGTHP